MTTSLTGVEKEEAKSFLRQAIGPIDSDGHRDTLDEPPDPMVGATGAFPLPPKIQPSFLEQALTSAKLRQRQEMLADISFPEKIRSAGSAFVRGFGNIVASVPKKIALAQNEFRVLATKVLGGIPQDFDNDARDFLAFQLGEQMSGFLAKHFPGDPRLRDTLFEQFAGGAGSMAAFMAGGVAASAAGAPILLSTIALGSSAESVSLYERAKRGGASDADAINAGLFGNLTGALEGIPISRAFSRFNKASGGKLGKGLGTILRQGAAGSIEEATQELVQSVAGQEMLRQIGVEERDFVQSLTEAGIGGTLGFIASAAFTAAGLRSRRRFNPDTGQVEQIPDQGPETLAQATGREQVQQELAQQPEQPSGEVQVPGEVVPPGTPRPEGLRPIEVIAPKTKTELLTPQGAAAVRELAPEAANDIAKKESPTRSDFKALKNVLPIKLLQSVIEPERAKFSRLLNESAQAPGRLTSPLVPKGYSLPTFEEVQDRAVELSRRLAKEEGDTLSKQEETIVRNQPILQELHDTASAEGVSALESEIQKFAFEPYHTAIAERDLGEQEEGAHDVLADARETANSLLQVFGLREIPPLTSQKTAPVTSEAALPISIGIEQQPSAVDQLKTTPRLGLKAAAEEVRKIGERARELIEGTSLDVVSQEDQLLGTQTDPQRRPSFSFRATKAGRSDAQELKERLPKNLKQKVTIVKSGSPGFQSADGSDVMADIGVDAMAEAIETFHRNRPSQFFEDTLKFVEENNQFFTPQDLLAVKNYRQIVGGAEITKLQAGQLAVGTELQIEGEVHRVTEIDPDSGAVVLENGVTLEIPSDGFVAADAGTIRPGAPERQIPSDLLGQPVIDPLTGASTSFDFGANVEGARIAEERAVQQEQKGGQQIIGQPASLGAPALQTQQQAPVEQPAVSHVEIIASMEQLFGIPFRIGRVPGKPAGIYKPHPEVVRMKPQFGGDIGVAVHELGHHIDKTTNPLVGISKSVKSELKALDYDPERRSVNEGFAEYIRHLLSEDNAAEVAPLFHKRFVGNYLPANPQVRQKLTTLREQIDRFRQQGSIARARAQIGSEGIIPSKPLDVSTSEWFKAGIGSTWDKLYTAMVDKGRFVDLYQRELKERGFKGPPGTGPYELFLSFSQIGPSWAHRAMTEGVFGVSSKNWNKKLGPSLVEALRNVPVSEMNSKDFQIWAFANHTIESNAQGKQTGLKTEDAEFIVNNHGTEEQRERWRVAAQGLTDYNNALIEMLADSGRISKETKDRIIGSYETYIPLVRIGRGSKIRSRLAGKIVDVPSPLRRRKGSALQIIDPLVSTLERTLRFYESAAQQQVVNSIWQSAKATDGMGGWVEPVPPDVQKQVTKFSEIMDQMKEAARKTGSDSEVIEIEANLDLLQSLDPDLELAIFRPIWRGDGRKAIAVIIEEGQQKLAQFHPEFYRAISGMNAIRMPWLLDQTVGRLTRTARLGITGLNPDFAARNLFKDYLTFLMQRERSLGAKGAVLPAKTISAYVYTKAMQLTGKQGDPIVREWERNGGPLATYLGVDMKQIKGKVTEIMADTTRRRALLIAKHPIHAVREVINTSEVGPRIAEFEAVLANAGFTRERIRSGDLPPREVVVVAINAANDVTVNFKRSGWLGRWINLFDLFFNPAVQGADKFARTWKVNPTRALMRASVLASATLAYWWLRKDDDDYQEMEPWLKYGFWTMTDERSKPIMRIPRAFEWGWLVSAMVEAIADSAYRSDPELFSEYSDAMIQSLMPNLIPHVVDPLLEIARNKKFGDRPIVAKTLEGREPKDQFTPYNTALIRGVADYLNQGKDIDHQISPVELEHLIDRYSGGIFKRTVKAFEGITTQFDSAADIPGIGGLTLRQDSTKSIGKFYDELNRASKALQSARFKDADNVDPEIAYRFRKFSRYNKFMRLLRKELDGVADRDERFKIERRMVGLARQALELPALDRYPLHPKD